MKKLVVVTNQPEDIFSDYLRGKGLEFERINPREIYQLNDNDDSLRILIVNQSLKDAIEIKNDFSLATVLTVNGGKEQFNPMITVIDENNNHDYHYFGSWQEFEKIIFSSDLIREKEFLYSHQSRTREGKDCTFYQVNPKINTPIGSLRVPAKEFDNFIEAMIFLSDQYLDWMENWIKEISSYKFEIKFDFKKERKIKVVKIKLDLKEHRGLPIFKVEDKVYFLDQDLNQISEGNVKQLNNNEMFVSFDHPIKRKELNFVAFYTPAPDYLDWKIGSLRKNLDQFKERRNTLKYVSMSDVFASNMPRPIDFLANCLEVREWSPEISLNRELYGFEKRSQLILRDQSQCRALIRATGYNFFSFISGPAATGKTFLCSCLIQNLFHKNKIVLVVSHSNRGVDNILKETAKHADSKNIFRLGRNTENMTKEARSFHQKQRLEEGFFGENKSNLSASQAEFQFIKKLIYARQGIILGCTVDSYHLVERILSKLEMQPDAVVIDEASKGYFFELLPVVASAKERVCFVGDDQQIGNLPPPKEITSFLEESLRKESLSVPDHPMNELQLPESLVHYFNYGFFNSLLELGFFKADLLKINRRSLKNLSDLGGQVFYQNQIVCGLFNPSKTGQVVFYDTKNIEKAVDKRLGTSSYNEVEANWLVKKFIQRAVNVISQGGKITDLVIITPYSAQVSWMKSKLRKHLLYTKGLRGQVTPENIDETLNDLVITVDSIQGGERKIVFISLVRSNEENEIGFNNDHRRIRVTCTRAKEEMIFVGNSETFIKCDYPEISEIFRKTIAYIKRRGIYVILKNNK